jgi:hypothetical protein
MNMSLLALPLSDDGADVNMAVSTLVARFNLRVTASTDWLKGAPVKVGDVVNVTGLEDLEKRCLDWERLCAMQSRPSEGTQECQSLSSLD